MQKYILFFLILFFISCEGGLNPETKNSNQQSTFLNGTVYFVGGANNWPPEDSVIAVRVVAFKNYPPGDIVSEILSGNAFFTFESLALFIDSAKFSIEISSAPVELKYIAVAQQYADSVTSQLAIGVYTESGDNTKPSPIYLGQGDKKDIKIIVDFDNLPPQPF